MVESVAASIVAGAAAFAATNFDDLFLLVAWFAAGARAREVLLGQYAGIGALFALSAAASLVSLAIPSGYLPLLGLVPILLGARLLFGKSEADKPASPGSGVLAVAAVTLANGGDNLGVYIPLFAASTAQAIGVMGAVFAVLTGLWCLAARWLVRHPAAGAPLRRHGPKAMPFVLMALGLAILLSWR